MKEKKEKSVEQQLAELTTKKRQQFHQSTLDVISRCELQAMYIYRLHIRRPPRVFMHVGTGVHRSVELDLLNKIVNGELLLRNDAVEIAAAAFDEQQAKNPIELEPAERAEGKSVQAILGESKDKTVALAGLHYDKVAPDLLPRYVEHPFSINMDTWLRNRAKGLHKDGDAEFDSDKARILHAEARAMNAAARIGTDLVGRRDVVEFRGENVTVRDVKTSTKKPSADIADISLQLDCYSLASVVFDKKLPSAVGLDYLIQTPARHDLKHHAMMSTRTMDDINVFLFRFARTVHRWHTAERTGDYLPARPTDWWCSEKFCGFFDRCPAAKRPKLVQIGAVPE